MKHGETWGRYRRSRSAPGRVGRNPGRPVPHEGRLGVDFRDELASCAGAGAIERSEARAEGPGRVRLGGGPPARLRGAWASPRRGVERPAARRPRRERRRGRSRAGRGWPTRRGGHAGRSSTNAASAGPRSARSRSKTVRWPTERSLAPCAPSALGPGRPADRAATTDSSIAPTACALGCSSAPSCRRRTAAGTTGSRTTPRRPPARTAWTATTIRPCGTTAPPSTAGRWAGSRGGSAPRHWMRADGGRGPSARCPLRRDRTGAGGSRAVHLHDRPVAGPEGAGHRRDALALREAPLRARAPGAGDPLGLGAALPECDRSGSRPRTPPRRR